MIPAENGVHDARQANQSGARVAVALRDGGRATVAQLAERTGLSRPTVEAALPALRERGLVGMIEEHTAGGRGAGRPARIFEFVADAGLLVGVDVGIHRVRVVVADLTGRIVAWHQRDIEQRFVGADRLDYVKDAVRTCFDRAGIDIGRLATLSGMAVAVSGMVGPDGRLAVSHNFPDWEGVDIAGRLREEFGCPAVIENDMRLAALAEHRMGAARLVDDVAYFFAGHRISMGLIIDGKLRRGRHGAAGEIGGSVFSMHVDDSGQLRWETAETAEEVFRAAAAGVDFPDSTSRSRPATRRLTSGCLRSSASRVSPTSFHIQARACSARRRAMPWAPTASRKRPMVAQISATPSPARAEQVVTSGVQFAVGERNRRSAC
ncbi:MAG: ROK family transcriptional regulator [Actinobacteria bacterium]|nr:ROK family transcriptional regulator [Actinomycetota bacterium]